MEHWKLGFEDKGTYIEPMALPTENGHVNKEKWVADRLAARESIPHNSNHYAVLETIEGVSPALVVNKLVGVYLELISSKPTLFHRKQQLCIAQISNLFGCARLPCDTSDIDNIHIFHASQHITVLCNGSLFEVQVIQDGKPVPTEQLQQALEKAETIAEENKTTGLGEGGELAYFTMLPRGDWRALRTELQKDIRNRTVLKCVESSLFVLGLDAVPEGHDWSSTCYAGDGVSRWYDQCFNVSVHDGSVALILEESCCDSVALSWLANKLYSLLKPLQEMSEVVKGMEIADQQVQSQEDKIAQTAKEGVLRHHSGSLKDPMLSRYPPLALHKALCTRSIRAIETPSFASLLYRLDIDYDALVMVSGALAFYRCTKTTPNAAHTVGLHSFAGGRNMVRQPVATSECVAFLKAICKDDPERIHTKHQVKKVLLNALDAAREDKQKAAQGSLLNCKDGHALHYSAERIWKPNPKPRKTYNIFGNPSPNSDLHFTYHICCHPNTFCFTWERPDFAVFPEKFKECLIECVGML